MNKFWIIPLLLVAGCSERPVTKETLTVVIYQVKKDGSCFGSGWTTYVKSPDHRAFKSCGDWGPPGMKIRGLYIGGDLTEGFYPGRIQ